MFQIAPSILAADFGRLGEQVLEVERAGADRIHVDVMDGHFVPNLSMGPVVVSALRPRTKLPLEVHLMVTDPAKFVEPFIGAGADSLIFHLEVVPEPGLLLDQIRALGKKAGLAINPDKPVDWFTPHLKHIDLALCMTVFPGFGGQKFIPESLDRIRRLRELIAGQHPGCELEVDGGIDSKNAAHVVQAGANVLVVGTGIFGYPQGPAAALEVLRRRG